MGGVYSFVYPRLILVLGNFKVETLFQKLWRLLYKRAELDLRATNYILLALSCVLK